MYYGEIKNCDIANGTGVRISLFVSGCRNHCPGCFQPETWNFSYGKPFTEETIRSIMDMLSPDYIDGLSILGGDPFEPENQRDLMPLIGEFRKKYKDKTIWAYTGYLYEDLLEGKKHPCCECTEELLKEIDVLVDGKFDEKRKNLSLQFRGSSNQRIIDVKKSMREGRTAEMIIRKRGTFFD